jgi:hypothetical protein
LIVQWQGAGFFGQPNTETATFQIQVPASGPAFAQFIYTNIEGTRAGGGSSATIGYQAGGTPSSNHQYALNAPNVVRNGTVLSLTERSALVLTDEAPGTWIEIAGTGTALNLIDDGAADISTTVGNGLFAAGVARVGSNGAVRFNGTGLALGFTNEQIPSTSAFNLDQCLLPFWDDVNTIGGTVGNIYWQEVGNTLVVFLLVLEERFLSGNALFLAFEQFLCAIAPCTEVVLVEDHQVPVHLVNPLVLSLDVSCLVLSKQVLQGSEIDKGLPWIRLSRITVSAP